MRRALAFMGILGAVLVFAGAASAGDMVAEIKMVMMECASSEIRVTASIESVAGVKKVATDTATGVATVTFDDQRTSLDAIVKQLEKDLLGVNKAALKE